MLNAEHFLTLAAALFIGAVVGLERGAGYAGRCARIAVTGLPAHGCLCQCRIWWDDDRWWTMGVVELAVNQLRGRV